MTSKYPLTITAIIFLVLIAGSLFFWINNLSNEFGAYYYYSSGNDTKAAEELEKEKKAMDPALYSLYSAYLSRRNDLKKSNEELIQATSLAQKDQKILFEIYLNQALNGYLERSPKAIEEALKKGEALSEKNKDWIIFFEGLRDFLLGENDKALKILSEQRPTSFVSKWWNKAFDHYFPPDWFFIHIAKINIEKGNLFQTRESLAEESKGASPKTLEQINMLIGLSYIKEASGKGYSAALPYYKLALSYFEKVPMDAIAYRDLRDQIVEKIANQMTGLIEANEFGELPFYAEKLKKWDASKKYTPVIENLLLEHLNSQFNSKNWKNVQHLAVSLNNLLADPQERLQLEQKFEKSARHALAYDQLEDSLNLFNMGLLFSLKEHEIKQIFSDYVGANIFELVNLDNDNLTLLIPYANLWGELQSDHKIKMAMAVEVAALGQEFWLKQQFEKGINLFRLSASLSPEKDIIDRLIAEKLKQNYEKANTTDNIEELKGLILAKQQLQLPDNLFHEKEDSAKKIEQAEALFQQNHLDEALKKALWVLEIEPGNQKALSISGLVFYEKGEYEESLPYLKKLKPLNEQENEALAISQVIAGDSAKGNAILEQIEKGKSLNSDAEMRIGLGLLERGKPAEGLKWLEKINNPGEEVFAGIAYAYYQLRQWDKALEYASKLSSPYQNLDAIKGLILYSDGALGKIDESEKLLENLLTHPDTTPLPQISQPFRIFKKNILDLQTPDLIAGTFYKNIKKDYPKALSYLEKGNQTNPIALTEIGEIFFQEKQWSQAVEYLNKAVAEKSPSAQILKEKLLPLLGESYLKLGDDIRSANFFYDYFNLFPQQTAYRNSYAEALINLRLYTDACKQLKMPEIKSFTSADKLNDIACLVHTGQFEEARDKGSLWLAQQPQMPLTSQLKMLEIMIPLRDAALTETTLEKVKDEKKLTLEEKEALLSFWIAVAQYEKAEELAKSLEQELKLTFEGLFLLTQLNAALSNYQKAALYGKEALKLDPDNPKAIDLLNIADFDIHTIQDQIVRIKNKIKEKPETFFPLLNLVKAYVAIAIKENKENPGKPIDEISTLKIGYQQVEALSKVQPNLPEVNFLLGKIAYLLNIKPIALNALKKAATYDISYALAYRYLAQFYFQQGDIPAALQNIKYSLQYSPFDPDAWLLMGLIYRQLDDALDALSALDRAILYRPNEPEAYIVSAGIKLEFKNPEGAKAALDKALKLDPNNEKALKLMLITLYDPFLKLDETKLPELRKEQKEVYDKLHKLDPEGTEKLLKKLKENNLD